MAQPKGWDETTMAQPASEDDYRVPMHSGITGQAKVLICTTVRFESAELMDSFCEWVSDQRADPPHFVLDFLNAAATARGEAERIRENLSRPYP